MTERIIDTCVLHYASQKGKDSYKYAEAFLKNYYNCSYQLFITEETHREIEVQREIMSATSPSAERALANIHQQCILSPIGYESDIQREHLLRMAAAYIRKVYDPDIPGISKRMTYPGVSDARIILSAYDSERIQGFETVGSRWKHMRRYRKRHKRCLFLLLRRYAYRNRR